MFPDIYKKGDEKNFPDIHFLNKLLQIFPLIPKFSKITLNFSLIIKIFPEKTKFCGGAKPYGGLPLFRRHCIPISSVYILQILLQSNT